MEGRSPAQNADCKTTDWPGDKLPVPRHSAEPGSRNPGFSVGLSEGPISTVPGQLTASETTVSAALGPPSKTQPEAVARDVRPLPTQEPVFGLPENP